MVVVRCILCYVHVCVCVYIYIFIYLFNCLYICLFFVCTYIYIYIICIHRIADIVSWIAEVYRRDTADC